MKKPLIIIAGPTATGKSKLSVKLAKAINGEIISADSMQVYKYMDIGSAKITKEEMAGIKHYIVDELYPDETFNIHVFQQMAKQAMAEIYEKGKIPIICGGTGFYIQSVIKDVDFTETDSNPEIRNELEKMADERGNEYLHEMLKTVDPVSYKTIHQNNVKRVIRAIEYYKLTGKPISVHNEEEKEKESPYNYLFYVLHTDREIMYDRINKRVDQMMGEGLLGEVENLFKLGYNKQLVAMQGLGYKEIYDYLLGECTLEESIYKIKRDTRHFAKRQLTWFRREKDTNWIDVNAYGFDYNQMVVKIKKDIMDNQLVI